MLICYVIMLVTFLLMRRYSMIKVIDVWKSLVVVYYGRERELKVVGIVVRIGIWTYNI